MKLLKYSYMPIQEFFGKSHVNGIEESPTYFIDSDERYLGFRNQYGEIFMLAPVSNITWSLIISVAFGFMLAWIIFK